MGVRVTTFFAALLAVPAIAAAQSYGTNSPSRSPTIIQPVGYEGWRNYVAVPDGPCGCAMPVRSDCYNDCCQRCCFRPICLLKTIHRALDCLLPCNKCCGGCLAHGCVLGGRCCNSCGPCGSSCCPSCGGGPMLSDPFQDDPPLPPPQPKAQPTSRGTGAEVRHLPPRKTSSAAMQPVVERSSMQQPSPWKVTGEAAPIRSRSASPAASRGSHEAASPSSSQSVLRRTSLEVEVAEPAQSYIESNRATTVIRGQSPADFEIPHNPLRN